ncbi:MAG: GIY-YIG nuclease family protein [Spirochaetales bacterium]|nr:GIY-YIG nuclease family protein [Spirochaetales bacterium]
MNYYVYILQCSDNSFYTGMTNDFEKRLFEHREGIDPDCYTYSRRPLELRYIEEYDRPIEAIEREKQIKQWSRKKKMALIENNYDNLILFSKRKKK